MSVTTYAWNQRADELTAKHTGFATLGEMLNAKGSYRPSMDMCNPELRELADYYDLAQKESDDPRRVYRYGRVIA